MLALILILRAALSIDPTPPVPAPVPVPAVRPCCPDCGIAGVAAVDLRKPASAPLVCPQCWRRIR